MVSNFFKRIRESLDKTRRELFAPLERIFSSGADITDDVLDEVEEVLYEADLGVHATELIVEKLRERASDIRAGRVDPFDVIHESVLLLIRTGDVGSIMDSGGKKPYVILFVGVNGTGKTTTTGKLAMRFRNEGKSVLIAACDTFRAAAIEQLEVWAERSDSEFIRSSIDADAAALAFDAMNRARSRGTDVVLIDTAGRLHTSRNLMAELKKIGTVIGRAVDGAPHETLLVLDATTGQNSLTQAETFNTDLGVTGIALTKLDGTAKGGIVVSIIDRLGIPVRLIGIGEGIGDLRDFDPDTYARALLGRDENA